MEGYDRRCGEDDEGGDDVGGRLHRGGQSHDEVAAQQPRPVVRSLLQEPAHLHHHGVHEG